MLSDRAFAGGSFSTPNIAVIERICRKVEESAGPVKSSGLVCASEFDKFELSAGKSTRTKSASKLPLLLLVRRAPP